MKKTFNNLRAWAGRRIGGRPLLDDVQSYYEGARESYNRETEKSTLVPAYNQEDDLDRVQMMREARQMEKDYEPVGHGLSELAKYTVPRGFRSQAGDREVERMINEFITKHMEAERFDYAQAHDFSSATRLAVLDSTLDGDLFGRLVRPKGERHFYLQSIRSDLIGSIEDHSVLKETELLIQRTGRKERFRVLAGAVMDSRMRRLYWEKYRETGANFKRFSPSSYQFEGRIPNSAMIHLYDPDHSDSIRGVTCLHATLTILKDIKTIWDYERKNQEFVAKHVGVVHNETGKADPRPRSRQRLGPNEDGTCSKCKTSPCGCDPPVREVADSKLIYLKIGEKMQEYTSTRPNATFLEFSKWLLSQGAMAFEMPYSILYDASGLNGGALRFELAKSTTSIMYLRSMVVVKRWAQPWVRAKILEGIQTGELPFRMSDLSALAKGDWTWPELPTADERYRSATFLKMWEAGLIGAEKVAELMGTTFDDVLLENSRSMEKVVTTAIELWERNGGDQTMPLAAWVDRLSMRGANGMVPYYNAGTKALKPPGGQLLDQR